MSMFSRQLCPVPARALPSLIVMALMCAAGGTVSAQIPPNATPEQIKKITDDATALKLAYEALTGAETARKTLAASQDAGKQSAADQLAAVKAAKDLADAQKAQADAEKAQTDAAVAAAKARIGEVPASGYTGAAEMAAGAGNAEAMLLGAVAVNQIADKLAQALKTDKPVDVTKLLLYASQTVPDFQALLAFNAQFEALDFAVRQARETTKGADIDVDMGLAASVGMVGLGLDAINKVLAFFKTDYKFQGIEVASSDTMLLVAVAQQLRVAGIASEIPAVYHPSAASGAGAVMDRSTALYGWALEARQRIRLHGLAQARLDAELAQKIKDKAEAEAKALQDRIQKVKEAIAVWTAVGDRIDAWAKQAAGADDKGNVPLATIVRQSALRLALDNGGAMVVLQLHKMAGTGYTKKNLWSSLGANPFYVMGGAVASVMAFHGKTGVVFSSALVPWHGGYHSVSDIKSVVNRSQ